MEPKKVQPGAKKGSPIGTAKALLEPFFVFGSFYRDYRVCRLLRVDDLHVFIAALIYQDVI